MNATHGTQPINCNVWGNEAWDFEKYNYIHVVFIAHTAVTHQRYYECVKYNKVDGNEKWERAVLENGKECQLRYGDDNIATYCAVEEQVKKWACLSINQNSNDYVIRFVKHSIDGSTESMPIENGVGVSKLLEDKRVQDSTLNGGKLVFLWTNALSVNTRVERSDQFVDDVPVEYVEHLSKYLDTPDEGNIQLVFETSDDDTYLNMLDIIMTNEKKRNYSYSSFDKFPSASVVSIQEEFHADVEEENRVALDEMPKPQKRQQY